MQFAPNAPAEVEPEIGLERENEGIFFIPDTEGWAVAVDIYMGAGDGGGGALVSRFHFRTVGPLSPLFFS